LVDYSFFMILLRSVALQVWRSESLPPGCEWPDVRIHSTNPGYFSIYRRICCVSISGLHNAAFTKERKEWRMGFYSWMWQICCHGITTAIYRLRDRAIAKFLRLLSWSIGEMGNFAGTEVALRLIEDRHQWISERFWLW
jgi:hypothetical protein